MKKYRTLRSIFHEKGRETADQEAARRRKAGFETAFKLGNTNLFYTATPQLLLLQEEVFRNEKIIESRVAEIPFAVQWVYRRIIKNLASDKKSKNKVKRSSICRIITQETFCYDRYLDYCQIQEAFKEEPIENAQFREVTRIYLELSRGEIKAPVNLLKIRQLYDNFFSSEILAEDANDALDGKLFRANPVDIGDGTKNIHTGAVSEGEIFSQLQAMQDHLEEDQVPFLISRLVAHFMFEAVHPFYNGNGRSGRFVLSAQLYEVLSAYTVLTLSAVIYKKKGAYHKAFNEVEHPCNMGEATYFAQVMLGFILEAQQAVIQGFSCEYQS